MNGRGRDSIIIGLMAIFTYFLVYAFFGTSKLLLSMGGLPLINCTTSLIRNGFSAPVIAALTKDFGQTIIVVFIVVFIQNIIPDNRTGGFRRVTITILGYIGLFFLSIWFVRSIVFSDRTGEILQMFIAIFSAVIGGLGAIFAPVLRRVIRRSTVERVLRDNLLNSRPIQWMSNAFYITSIILFLAVAIEMAVGLPFFFNAVVAGIPAIITLILMLIGVYSLILGRTEGL